METHFTGIIWKLGDDIDTDIIMPTQWLTLDSMEDIKTHAFEPLRPELAQAIQPGDIIVAGNNFGCGSSREQAPEALSALKLSVLLLNHLLGFSFVMRLTMGSCLLSLRR